jgi:4-hydroxy-3-polyprenylbenzoate decarboxylase
MRLIVGMSGATGAIFGVRLLEALRALDVETHLVVSPWADQTIKLETEYSPAEVRRLASVAYDPQNQAAAISSGSFVTAGMIVAPCSMKLLSAIAHGYGEDLIARAADVVIKERRKLVLIARETPLNSIHLENMLRLSNLGAVILPPMPAFYNRPRTLDDVVNHIVARALDQFGLHTDLTQRWGEPRRRRGPAAVPAAPDGAGGETAGGGGAVASRPAPTGPGGAS